MIKQEYGAMPEGDESPLCVVGIGASAGGLEAISEMLSKVPDSTGMAFVVIQHLSPDYKSMLYTGSDGTNRIRAITGGVAASCLR